MTDKEFLHQLRRGIGSAVIELNQNDNREKYKEIVYRCCLKDIGFDTQVEGTKGYYLYTAISALRCEDEFLESIAKAYKERLPHRLMQQLTDILLSYVQDGSSKAAAILKDKYEQLKEKLTKQRIFPYRYCEREQFELLMIVSMSLGKWRAFKQCVEDAGVIIQARKDDQCSYYDWFLDSATNQFGKSKVWEYLNSASSISQNVNVVVSEFRKVELTRKNHQAILPYVTLEFLIEETQKCLQNQSPYGINGYLIRFAREASRAELIELANRIEAEDNDFVRTQLLRVFRRIDYPLGIEFLINLVQTNNLDLRQAAIEALERFRDKRIHDLAIKILEAGDTASGLTLLKENWEKPDDILIRKVVTKSQRVPHNMQMDLRDIYSKHRSYTCGEVLIHAYRNGECSFCRSEIVTAMGKNGILPDGIILECQFDSYDETRKYANRLVKRREITQ
ncbi:HEAT repeat domain-containing protein [Anaerocolumna sp. AGMB13020]|uniref:HEAT repeat domain-containing protein n=1 Tax=Anaerocolumna sp. AGMB13020 TaxID=3081750 RepID=UPI0029536457|nr:HEAT repeat domain-containing protein [Anaerocolumna sp. AGMB13020]WOO38009.1 HEAT repeat domain-containing protein [Anaerocolumna sp. AGMB13020]